MLLAGCLSKSKPDIEYYNFSTGNVSQYKTKFGTVFVRDFYINPAYEVKNFVYQTGDLSYESDYYNQLQLSPRTAFSTTARAYLADSGLFKSVIMPLSAINSDFFLEGNVNEFYADFRNKKSPFAKLNIEFKFYPNSRTRLLSDDPLLTKTYQESIAISGDRAADVAAAWNQAYNKILSRLLKDLSQVTPPKPEPKEDSPLSLIPGLDSGKKNQDKAGENK